METQPAFLRAEGAVHLNAEPAVDLDLPLIIQPGYAKGDDPFGFGDSFQNRFPAILRIAVKDRLHTPDHVFQRLMEFCSTKDDEQRKARLVSLGLILVSLLVLWWFFS